jgi:CDP-diacylglycerol--glycerol-3-phosphate 3-phosphatidyltransferase
MANGITSLRLVMLFVLVWSAYRAPPEWQLLNAPLLVVIFLMDALDGWVARTRREETLFGSIYDIAADRVVENVLWIALADLDLVPVWVALVFVTRGILVDAVRSVGASHGRSPFSLTRSRLGRFLIAGRFMRAAYATVKALAFAWVLLVQPWPALMPEVWVEWQTPIARVTMMLVYAAVALCLARGLPVLYEFGLAEGQLFSGRRTHGR